MAFSLVALQLGFSCDALPVKASKVNALASNSGRNRRFNLVTSLTSEAQSMIRTRATPDFASLGQIMTTKGARDVLEAHGISALRLLYRHAMTDWEKASPRNWVATDQVDDGGDIRLSSYQLANDCVVWVITKADRLLTTLLLPEEY